MYAVASKLVMVRMLGRIVDALKRRGMCRMAGIRGNMSRRKV